MIVCLCNALRERDCREAAAHPDNRCVGCVYRRLGCRVRCGACVQTMREILDHARTTQAETRTVYEPLLNEEELV